MTTNEYPLNSFPPRDAQEINALIQYIETSSMEGKNWAQLKKLFKQLEQNPIDNILVTLLLKLDNWKVITKSAHAPSVATIGYMKRRAIRLLKKIAKENPKQYISISFGMLSFLQQINISQQWIAAHLLLGNSKRYYQLRNGRGAIVQQTNMPNVKRREEIESALWDQNIATVKELLSIESLDPLVYEFCVKVLLRNKENQLVLSPNQINQFYKINSPWLQWAAFQQCFHEIENETFKNVSLLAGTYFFAPADQQEKVFEEVLGETPKENKVSTFQKIVNKLFSIGEQIFQQDSFRVFINKLAELVFQRMTYETTSRRMTRAIQVLKDNQSLIRKDIVRKYFSKMIQSENLVIKSMVFELAKNIAPKNICMWLVGLEELSIADKEKLYQILYIKNALASNSQGFIKELIYDEEFMAADYGWFLLSKKRIKKKEIIKEFLQELRWLGWRSKSFQNMVKSKYACELMASFLIGNRYQMKWSATNTIKIFQYGSAGLKDMAKGIVLNQTTYQFFKWLKKLSPLKEERDEIASTAFSKLQEYNINNNRLFAALVSKNKWIKDWAWKIFDEKIKTEKTILNVFEIALLQYQTQKTDQFLQAILAHPNPKYKNYLIQSVEALISQNTWVVDRVVKAVEKHIDIFQPSTIIQIIQHANDKAWNNLKGLINNYVSGTKQTLFWLQALKAMESEESSILVSRLLEDTSLRNKLLELKDFQILNIKHSIFEDLLEEWLSLHLELITKDSQELFKTCTHRLHKVRQIGLQQFQILGTSQAFALRLIESDIPDTVTTAKKYFDAQLDNDAEILDKVLSLCDSPNPIVREYGVNLLQKKEEKLKSNLALECLSEHTDPSIQVFVAQQIDKNKPKNKFVQQFDRELLGHKNRSRKAKELIKKRISQNLKISSTTLLQMARGQNKKDKEWAIQQLVKLKLAQAADGKEYIQLEL